jgi:hypothetical protein
MRIATAVWWAGSDLILALDERLGPPVDSYVNGSQTWFTDDDQTLEWRLHPAAGFALPAGLSHYDLWEQVVAQLSAGVDAGALVLAATPGPLTSLWDGLECFPAYDDDLEPATVARRAGEILGVPPALSGVVDHEPIGDAWERSGGSVSIVELLAQQLRA